MMKHLHLACWFLLFGALAGCGLKKYPNTLEKNLLVRTTVSGSLFNSVEAYLHVYDPKDDCKKDYLGAIKLKNGDTHVGIPVGRPVHVDFVFYANAQVHNPSIVTLLPGERYIALVRYVDRIYSLSIREIGSHGVPGREIPYQKSHCPPP